MCTGLHMAKNSNYATFHLNQRCLQWSLYAHLTSLSLSLLTNNNSLQWPQNDFIATRFYEVNRADCTKTFFILQSIGIVAIKSRQTKAVIYTFRYSSGQFNPYKCRWLPLFLYFLLLWSQLIVKLWVFPYTCLLTVLVTTIILLVTVTL